MDKIWITYILLCKNNKLYVGVTNDLEKRLLQHKGLINGGAKYTRANPAIDFVYIEPHLSKSVSQKREYILKQKTKKQKEELIKDCNFIKIRSLINECK